MNSTLPSGYVKGVLQNGVGRYVCQMQRLIIKFCKTNGASKGVRQFIENDIVDFARNNPGVVIYLKPRRHHSPGLFAHYLNGEQDYISCHQFSNEEVIKHVRYLTEKSGFPIIRLRKFWHTDTPSIQGIWTPFDRIDPEMNIAEFPLNLNYPKTQLSATDILQQMAKNANLNESIASKISSTSSESN